MAQYQSFPDVSGDSRTSDKLKALKLPDLSGRSFLDVGCNEGFFCGFARFIGAAHSVGIDHSAEFIYRAQQRFPDCEFHVRNWEHLPDGAFDVILLASALHYAEDQPELIRRLVDRLTPDGVLIIELGIVSSPKAEWVKVKRGIDERYFPTMAQLKQTLVDYAWKWMGASINQAGDPVARHVIHVSSRKPVAYLLMQPPAYGKSSVASRLFPAADVPVVSGDAVIQRIARKELEVPPRLQVLVEKHFSPFAIDQTIQRVFDKKLGTDLVDTWIAEAGNKEFAMDGFVPAKEHAQVRTRLANAGYMPVTLDWQRIGPSLLPMDSLHKQARAFYRSLEQPVDALDTVSDKPAASAMTGFVDDVQIDAGKIHIRGWAIEDNGDAPAQLVVGIGAERTFVDVGDPQQRKDVQRHLQSPHATVGYAISLAAPTVASLEALGKQGFSVTLTCGRPLRIARKVTEAMQGGASQRASTADADATVSTKE